MTKVQNNTAKKQRKRRAATNAIREIKTEQRNTNLIVPVAPMNRLISEIASEYKVDLRFKGEAYRALHSAAEEYLVDTFQRANLCAIHDKRETVQPKDVQLAKLLLTQKC